MVLQRLIHFVEWLFRRASDNHNRSFTFRGVRFITVADLRAVFPETIVEEDPAEDFDVPDLELGKTAFLLEGTAEPDNLNRWLKGYRVHLQDLVTALFRADAHRKLFSASGCLLVQDSKLGTYCISPEYKSSTRIAAAFRRVSSTSIPSFLAITSLKSCTFGDFGLVMLPKLARIALSPVRGMSSLPTHLPYVKQYLELFKIPAVPAELDNRKLIPVTEFAQVVIGPGTEGVGSSRSDNSKVRQRMLPRLKRTNPRHVYLCRSGRRRILNEEQLLPMLRGLGLEIVPDCHTDVIEQATLFYNSEFIVAPHGALLANMIYCEQNTMVVELLPGTFTANWFRSTAANLRLHYRAIVCSELGPFRDADFTRDFSADNQRLHNAIKIMYHDFLAGRKLPSDP